MTKRVEVRLATWHVPKRIRNLARYEGIDPDKVMWYWNPEENKIRVVVVE